MGRRPRSQRSRRRVSPEHAMPLRRSRTCTKNAVTVRSCKAPNGFIDADGNPFPVPCHLTEDKGCTVENPEVSEWLAMVAPSQQTPILTANLADKFKVQIRALMIDKAKCDPNKWVQRSLDNIYTTYAGYEEKFYTSDCRIHKSNQLQLLVFGRISSF